MPLDDIADLLDGLDQPDRVHKVLDTHRRRLADELARHEQMLAFLARLLTNEETLMPYDITIEDVPRRRIASVRLHATLPELKTGMGAAFGRVAVFHDVIDEQTAGDVDAAIPTSADVDERRSALPTTRWRAGCPSTGTRWPGHHASCTSTARDRRAGAAARPRTTPY